MINKNRDAESAKLVELSAAKRIEDRTGASIVMMPEYSKFDYMIYRNIDGVDEAVSIAEFRSRPSTDIGSYKDICLDLVKVESIMSISDMMGLPALFIVQWRDGLIRYIDIDKHYRSGFMERRVSDRASDDKRQVVFYNTDQFRTLCNLGR